jgi:hypothetical protein
MVACEASGAREHGNDSKQEHQVEGPITQGKEWTRAFGRCNSWSTRATKSRRGDDCAGRKSWARGARATAARSAALSFLCLCAPVFVPRTTVDIAILPKLDCSNNSHP